MTMNLTNRMGPPGKHPLRRRPKTTRCQHCKAMIKIKSRGRVPRFCSATCRQLAYEQRRWQRPTPVELMAQFKATFEFQSFLRAEIWSILQAAGLVALNQPLPPPPPKRRQPTHLRVVEPQPDQELPDAPSELPKPTQDH